MKAIRAAIVTSALLLLAGCSHVSAARYYVHQHGTDHEKESRRWFHGGIETFRAEPYLLVKNTGNKDKPIEVDLIYLPDYDHMTLLKQTPGIGTSSMAVTMNGAMLGSLNATQDSKTAEILSAIATPLGTVGAALAGAAGTAGAAGLTSLGNIVVAALQLGAGQSGGTGQGLTLASDDCSPIEQPQWVKSVRNAVEIGAISKTDDLALAAAVWMLVEDTREKLPTPTVDGGVGSTALCFDFTTALNTLSGTMDKEASAKTLVALQGLAKKLKAANAPKTYSNAIDNAIQLLMGTLGISLPPDKPFQLFKIDAAGIYPIPTLKEKPKS